MILRRVTEHVKAQNWFAVALDFLIVVVGVFIGIQVSNWNDARAQRAYERTFLSQLREEIIGITAIVVDQKAYAEQVVEAGDRALAYLNGDADCERDCEALLIDFFHASQVWGTPYDYTKYQEAQRLGFPSNPETRRAVNDFYEFTTGSLVNTTAPAYRERIRGHLTPAAANALWGACYEPIGGQIERLMRNCAEDLKPLGAAAMLQDIRADAALKPALQFWIGQNVLALRINPTSTRNADTAIAALTGDIGDIE